MLRLDFDGWFQCRLATDPDPTEELRGVSGFTFAAPGEPDFDRLIRFHDPIAPRSHTPEVGVFVRAVHLHGHDLPEHPLLGARVDLLDEPKFESRNYVLGESSRGPIEPFHPRFTGGGVTLSRRDFLVPEAPELDLVDVPHSRMARRRSIVPLTIDQLKIADATGIRDPLAYRAERRRRLEADLARTEAPLARAALQKRIRELSITDPSSLEVATLTLYNDFRFSINGPIHLDDPSDQLGCAPLETDWPIVFWMGGWDSDALCGFVRGMLSIPVNPAQGEKR